jgi:hypothetical protein
MRDGSNPDIALMSFVKSLNVRYRHPAISQEHAVEMIVQGWRRSLKTSVIKL